MTLMEQRPLVLECYLVSAVEKKAQRSIVQCAPSSSPSLSSSCRNPVSKFRGSSSVWSPVSLRLCFSQVGATPDTLPALPLQVLSGGQPLGFSQLLMLSPSSYLQATLPLVGPQGLHSRIPTSLAFSHPLLYTPHQPHKGLLAAPSTCPIVSHSLAFAHAICFHLERPLS